jgi:hypothetical protein
MKNTFEIIKIFTLGDMFSLILLQLFSSTLAGTLLLGSQLVFWTFRHRAKEDRYPVHSIEHSREINPVFFKTIQLDRMWWCRG